MFVQGDQVHGAIAGKVRETGAGAPEEGGCVVKGVWMIGQVLVQRPLSHEGALVCVVLVAFDDELLSWAEARLLQTPHVPVPEDPIGLVRQHQVGEAVPVPIDETGIGVAHVVPVLCRWQDLVAQQVNPFGFGLS